MDLDTYLRASRTLPEKPPPELPNYIHAYASLIKICPEYLEFSKEVTATTFPHLVIVYSLQRAHEIARIGGELYLIYDQYVGQTFNMLNRIWLNSDDRRDGEMFAFKLLAEYYATRGEGALAGLCAGAYATLHVECSSYKRERDIRRRNTITIVQEVFVMAHELAHLIITEPGKYFGPHDKWTSGMFTEILQQMATALGLSGCDFSGLGSDSDFGTHRYYLDEMANAGSAVHECQCDLIGALLTVGMQIHYGEKDLSDTLLAIAYAVRHLRVMGLAGC
jgi:hypothetical protein